MEKGFGYTRLSGKGQEAGDGVERQKIAITEFARRENIEIVAWFHDTQTGKDEWEEREGWSAMIAGMNGVRTVLVEKLDRVARVVLVQELILRDLKKRNIRMLSSAGDDTDDDRPEREMLRQMLGVFASFERRMITVKLRGARQRVKARDGRCEGRKPYAQHPEHPEEKEILQHIVELSATRTITEISRTLNTEGVHARGGGPWYPMTVKRILEAVGSSAPHGTNPFNPQLVGTASIPRTCQNYADRFLDAPSP